jgi:hypothetical protein
MYKISKLFDKDKNKKERSKSKADIDPKVKAKSKRSFLSRARENLVPIDDKEAEKLLKDASRTFAENEINDPDIFVYNNKETINSQRRRDEELKESVESHEHSF